MAISTSSTWTHSTILRKDIIKTTVHSKYKTITKVILNMLMQLAIIIILAILQIMWIITMCVITITITITIAMWMWMIKIMIALRIIRKV